MEFYLSLTFVGNYFVALTNFMTLRILHQLRQIPKFNSKYCSSTKQHMICN